MEKFFQVYIEWLEKLHADFKTALEGLPAEALDWSPGADINSLAVLAAHTAGAERYWIGDVVLKDASQRDREAEFATLGLDAQALKDKLDASLEYARQNLPGLRLEDLDADRFAPRSGQTSTIGWALLHALEHLAQHTAHAQLTRQLWDQGKGK